MTLSSKNPITAGTEKTAVPTTVTGFICIHIPLKREVAFKAIKANKPKKAFNIRFLAGFPEYTDKTNIVIADKPKTTEKMIKIEFNIPTS